MIPRVTQNMMSDQFLADLNDIYGRMAKVHAQLTSGKAIRRPSDDPPGAVQALSLRSTLELNTQYLRTIDFSTIWLDTSESALGTLTDVVQRARELAVQGTNDTLNAQDRAAMGKELEQLVGSAIAAANTSGTAGFLFSGAKSTTTPFVLAASTVTYDGDTTTMSREIGPSLQIAINVTGDRLTQTLQTLVDVRDAMNSGSGSAIGAGIGQLDTSLDQLMQIRAEVGARVNRFGFAGERLLDVQLQLQTLLSQVEDADTVKTATKFAQEQTVFQAALKSGAQAIQPSLLDFLR